jgi:hypothetical protein
VLTFKKYLLNERIGAIEDRDDDGEYKEFRTIINEIWGLILDWSKGVFPYDELKVKDKGISTKLIKLTLDLTKVKSLGVFYPKLFRDKSVKDDLNVETVLIHSFGKLDIFEQLFNALSITHDKKVVELIDELLTLYMGSVRTSGNISFDDETGEYTIKCLLVTKEISLDNNNFNPSLYDFIKSNENFEYIFREECRHFLQNLLISKTSLSKNFDKLEDYLIDPYEIGAKIEEGLLKLDKILAIDKFYRMFLDMLPYFDKYEFFSKVVSSILTDFWTKTTEDVRHIHNYIHRKNPTKVDEIEHLVYIEVIEPFLFTSLLPHIKEYVDKFREEELGKDWDNIENNISWEFFKKIKEL